MPSTWTRTRQDEDLVIERDGATVLVDDVSIQYIDGSVIDFVDDLIGQSFKIENHTRPRPAAAARPSL